MLSIFEDSTIEATRRCHWIRTDHPSRKHRPRGLGKHSCRRSGISAIDIFDVTDFSSRIGGLIRNFDVTTIMPAKEARKTDPFIHYGLAAGVQAIEDSGLEINNNNADRVGIAIGSGIGGLPGIERGHDGYLAGGPRKISPFFVPSNIINMIAGNLSIRFGIRGPNYGVVTACSTGTHNIGDAARMIERGDVDAWLQGVQKWQLHRWG